MMRLQAFTDRRPGLRRSSSPKVHRCSSKGIGQALWHILQLRLSLIPDEIHRMVYSDNRAFHYLPSQPLILCSVLSSLKVLLLQVKYGSHLEFYFQFYD
jgi:hypothetical protein